jgi:hypothetical protein
MYGPLTQWLLDRGGFVLLARFCFDRRVPLHELINLFCAFLLLV